MEGFLLSRFPGAGPSIFGRCHSLNRTVVTYTKKWICSEAYFDNFAVISREEFGLSLLTLIFFTPSPHVPRESVLNFSGVEYVFFDWPNMVNFVPTPQRDHKIEASVDTRRRTPEC